MATLRFLWVIHTTSTQANADTENKFRLNLLASPFPFPQGTTVRLPFPDLPSPDERERGVTEEYRFDLSGVEPRINMTFLDAEEISITILGDDAWLPASIWVIGEDVNSTRRLLAGVPNWPTSVSRGWFSTDTSEGRATRSLLIQPEPVLG
jgi:hypothetical protein